MLGLPIASAEELWEAWPIDSLLESLFLLKMVLLPLLERVLLLSLLTADYSRICYDLAEKGGIVFSLSVGMCGIFLPPTLGLATIVVNETLRFASITLISIAFTFSTILADFIPFL